LKGTKKSSSSVKYSPTESTRTASKMKNLTNLILKNSK